MTAWPDGSNGEWPSPPQVRIDKNRLGYKVPSQSGSGSYVVNLDGKPFCTCPDFEKRQASCKHVYAVEFIIQREERSDGTTVETKAVRVTYSQDWPAYNAAQVHEGEHFATWFRLLLGSALGLAPFRKVDAH